MPGSDAGRLSGIMLKALRLLPQKEQDTAVRALLKSALEGGTMEAGSFSPPESQPHQHLQFPEPEHFLVEGEAQVKVDNPMTEMFPVRLSPELRDRLRTWSTDHGFAMAVVVRGLIERFLDEQDRTGP